MTHTTETRRTLAPRRRSLEHSDAMQPMGIRSAPTGSAVSRAFMLRNDCTLLGGTGTESRAISTGEDS